MTDNLATYLNDHLAGSVAGVEIVDHLIEHIENAKTRQTLTDLKAQIEKDRDELSGLMKRLGIEESSIRKAAGWLSEKGAELKLRFDDPSGGELLIFESLEALSLGIEGKRSLWRALSQASKNSPDLLLMDYSRLRKSGKQRKVVEALRLQYAPEALVSKNERDASREGSAPK